MRDKNQSGANEQVIRRILEYLLKHPEAKDTTEGILKWWLGDDHVWGKGEIQQALDFMTLKGWLTERKTVPKKEVYGIKKDRLWEIKSFLRQYGAGS